MPGGPRVAHPYLIPLNKYGGIFGFKISKVGHGLKKFEKHCSMSFKDINGFLKSNLPF
jgi:hypothetical protein